MKPINVIKFSYSLPNSSCKVNKISLSNDSEYIDSAVHDAGAMPRFLESLFENNNTRNLFIFDYLNPREPIQNPLNDLGRKIKMIRSQLHKMIWPNTETRKEIPFVGFLVTIPSKFLSKIMKGKTEQDASTSEIDMDNQEILLQSSNQSIENNTPVIVRDNPGNNKVLEKLLTWFHSVHAANASIK